MESGRSRSSSDVQMTKGPPKFAPRSAAPLGGRRRDRARRGRTASATTYRMTLSPALCGVGPGRMLEISSSLHQTNLTIARDRLEDHVGSHDSHMIQQQQRLSTSLPTGGFLRSARLHPLGIVDTPLIQVNECLGIVATSARREGWRRPCSVSAESRIMPDQRWERRKEAVVPVEGKGHVKNRRSSSAVAFDSRQVQHHSRAIVLPKNTALTSMTTQTAVCAGEETSVTPKEQQQPHLLPPVLPAAQEKEREMRVEVRSFRRSQNSTCNETTAAATLSSRLPDISSFSQQDTGSGANRNELISDGEKEMAKRVSFISLGEMATSVQERPRRHNTQGKHRLPEGKQGKLSLGWSPTRPVGSVTGHAVHQQGQEKRESITETKSRETKTGLDSAGEAAVSRDYIQINVHEYLANIHV